MKDDKLYLIHISECIERIETCVSEGGKEAFIDQERVWLVVERRLPDLKRVIGAMLEEQP
jgi:uncharacterized protein with HEPN domain